MNNPAAPEVRHSGKPFVFAWIAVILLGFATVAIVRTWIVSIEGVYDLEICVGKSPDSKCVKGVAHLKAGKIQAIRGDDGNKFTLEGDLEPSGDATFHLMIAADAGKGDAKLKGTLKDGHLAADGAFTDGKPVHLSMDKAGG